MVKIGIVARISKDEENKSCFLLRESNLRRAIIKSGGIPILLIPQEDIDYQNFKIDNSDISEEVKNNTLEILNMCDGFILPGGDEWTYLDEVVIEYAYQSKKPLLGLCLGMQIMAIDKDFSRMKDLNDSFHLQKRDYVHKVIVKEESILFKILNKKEIMVNSRHRHTPIVSDKFDIIGKCEEVVEAIELKEHPFFLGLQWHPEDMFTYDEDAKIIFSSFIRACKK